MFKRSRYLFTHKKKTHKSFFFLLISALSLTIAYCSINHFLQQKISMFLERQQSFLQKQNISLKFQSISHSSWEVWPYLTIIYPILQKNNLDTTIQFFWQAKEAKITYSLWHPLSIVIQIDGDQLFCNDKKSTTCLQIHGKPWQIYLPLIDNRINKSFALQCDETFYTNNTKSSGTLQSLQLTKITANLYWNNNLEQTNNSLAFSKINIHKVMINLVALPPQQLKHIKFQAALIQKNNPRNTSNNLYKLLIQKANFSANNLSANVSGKLYIPYPQIIPTGELTVHLNGVNQTIYQELIPSTCCQKLKEELIKTPLPSQLNFTLLIREGDFYLGTLPLQENLYGTLKTLMQTYAK